MIAVPPAPASFALFGDRVVFPTVAGRTVTLRDDTGAVLGTVRVPRGNEPDPDVIASPERVAMTVFTEDDRYSVRYTGVFAGPPLAPLVGLHDQVRTGDLIRAFDVDGPRVYSGHFRTTLKGGIRWTVQAPGQPETTVPLPKHAFAADFAGDRVAFSVGRRVSLADRTTGVVSRRFRIHDLEDPFVLRDDGTLAYVRGDGLYRVPPGGPRTRLADLPDGANPGDIAWAGDRVVLARQHRVITIAPDGTRRRLGPRSREVDQLTTSGDTVAWSAAGCLVVADVDDGPTEDRVACGRPRLSRARR